MATTTTTTKGHTMKLFMILSFALLAMIIAPSKDDAPQAPMTACTYEDGSGPQTFPCYWDAHTRGNGQGTSFVIWTPEDAAR